VLQFLSSGSSAWAPTFVCLLTTSCRITSAKYMVFDHDAVGTPPNRARRSGCGFPHLWTGTTYPGPDDGSSPALSLVGLDNQIFSPAPNPYVEPAELKTKILIRYDQPATTLVTVQDAAGTPVRSLVLPLANTNETVTIAWDGRDEQGRLVIDAGYGLVIQGSNLFGRSSNSETVEVRLFY